MRTLDFIVDKQLISKSPDCDFGGLVAGSNGYLLARFTFSNEWAGFMKVATFIGPNGEVANEPLVGNTCRVPGEVLGGGSFKVTVTGKRGTDRLPCSYVTVIQRRC